MKYFKNLWVILLMTGCATEKTGYYKGYELPPYTVSKTYDMLELRTYQPQLVAEVVVEGERDMAVGQGFRILANYIFGNNIAQKTVAMTTPVAQRPADEKEGKKWVVQFGMPKEYTLDTLPKANDERIKFRITKPSTAAVIQFSGRWNEKNFQENKAQLEQFITGQNLKAIAAPSFAYYDDPFTLPWNRRNEIIILVEP
jgi:hypothetical protein